MKKDTLTSLLKKGTDILAKAGNEEAGLDAWLLLEYTTGKSRTFYFAHPEEVVPQEQADRFEELIRRRAEHIPLQHLTHQAFFMGYEFFVNEHVLVPRQDTECVVERALELLRPCREAHVLDMCTGSGCILLSILLEKPESTGEGADISGEALAVAAKNAGQLGVDNRAVFVHSDLFSGEFFSEKDGEKGAGYDMLISNPPYIATEEIKELMEEVQFHDPRGALDGGEDGLTFYRKITAGAGRFLKPGGYLVYEIGHAQGGEVAELMRRAGFVNVEIRKDYGGLDRMVCGQMRLENQEDEHV